MNWTAPLSSESDLLKLFRELGDPFRTQLFIYAWSLAYPDHYFGGPMHGEPIDEQWWHGSDDPDEIFVPYDDLRDAIYALSNGLGIYVFRTLRPNNQRSAKRKRGVQ